LNLVRIEGDEATVRELIDIPDIILVLASTDRLGGGRIRTAAYASDRAIGEIEGRGATVTTVMDNAALDGHIQELFSQIEPDEPPVG
jgi:hypothetical protein